jgi:transposase
VARLAEGVSAVLDSAGLFLRLAIQEDGKKSSQLWFGEPPGSSGASPDQRQRSLTVRVHRQPKPAVREASTPANVSYGRKRHIVTDTNGFCLPSTFIPPTFRIATGPSRCSSGCDAGFPKLRRVFADRIYRGNQLVNALSHCGPWTIEIVERPHGVKGFQLLPRRWFVERTFAWFGRCRRPRTSKDPLPLKSHGSSSRTSDFRPDASPPPQSIDRF